MEMDMFDRTRDEVVHSRHDLRLRLPDIATVRQPHHWRLAHGTGLIRAQRITFCLPDNITVRSGMIFGGISLWY